MKIEQKKLMARTKQLAQSLMVKREEDYAHSVDEAANFIAQTAQINSGNGGNQRKSMHIWTEREKEVGFDYTKINNNEINNSGRFPWYFK